MKLNDLKKALAKAQKELQLAEQKAATIQRIAKAARVKFDQVRIEYKRVRKAAKQAKKIAVAAEEQACDLRRTQEKLQKRLAKALKKHAKVRTAGARKPVKVTASGPQRQRAKPPTPSISLASSSPAKPSLAVSPPPSSPEQVIPSSPEPAA